MSSVAARIGDFDPRTGAGKRSPQRAGMSAALAASILVHALLIFGIVAGGGLAAPRLSVPDRPIDIVSVQDFLPPPVISPAPAAPPSTPPPAAPVPAPAPPTPTAPAQAEAAPSDTTVLHEDLPPAEPGSTGLSAATGAPAPAAAPAVAAGSGDSDADYAQQFQITEAPVIPIKEALARIEYPTLAAKQGIQATVYLELYINKAGKIVRATVLKDPGYGFAEAAVSAIVGLICSPAKMNGVDVAVRFRYPVRFVLK